MYRRTYRRTDGHYKKLAGYTVPGQICIQPNPKFLASSIYFAAVTYMVGLL